MKISKSYYQQNDVTQSSIDHGFDKESAQLVLCFGAKDQLKDTMLFRELNSKYPKAEITMCSTAGEIYGESVFDDGASVVAFDFEKVQVKTNSVRIADFDGDSFKAGTELAKRFDSTDLSYVMIISDGALVNGSKLLQGIHEVMEDNVPVTGGLAGDAANFESTLVGLNSAPENGLIVGIGFYGPLKVGHGSMGGWEMFGLERTVTKSKDNELFEIDGKNALELYKDYLGAYADELPGSALLFPLALKMEGSSQDVVRTILSINEETKSMVFAGDVPEGAQVRFMRANFDHLVHAAGQAANKSHDLTLPKKPKFALLISCVGRKIILGNRIEEEVEAVRDVFGSDTAMAGFYSYGEISPMNQNGRCELHNQTMTITTFDE